MGKLVVRDLNPTTFNAISFSFLAIILTLIIMVTGFSPTEAPSLALAVMSGAFGFFTALQIYFYAMKRAPAHKVVPIANSSSVWTVFLALLLLGEGITAVLPLSLALVVCGAFLLAPHSKEGSNWRFAVPLAIAVAVLWGLNMIMQKSALNQGIGPLAFLLIKLFAAAVSVNLFAGATLSWRGQNFNMRGVGMSLASGLFANLIGNIFYLLAVEMENVSSLLPFTSAAIPVGFILSIFMVKERASRTAVIGMLVVFFGAVLAAM